MPKIQIICDEHWPVFKETHQTGFDTTEIFLSEKELSDYRRVQEEYNQWQLVLKCRYYNLNKEKESIK